MTSAGKIILILGLLHTCLAAAAPEEQLLEQLRINHAAMRAAESDFHLRRERGQLQGAEASDYAAYVARLYRRVAEDCAALRAVNFPIPEDLYCPAYSPAFIRPAEIDQAAEQTGTERTASLDAELIGALGEFDEMLLREQERVRAAAPRADAGGGGGGDGSAGGGAAGGMEGDAEYDGGETGAAGGEASTGSSTASGAGAGSGSRQSAGRSPPPPGTPDGSDDDVVARQLREAAEKETDPELRKKLWEEYRKYKEGTR